MSNLLPYLSIGHRPSGEPIFRTFKNLKASERPYMGKASGRTLSYGEDRPARAIPISINKHKREGEPPALYATLTLTSARVHYAPNVALVSLHKDRLCVPYGRLQHVTSSMVRVSLTYAQYLRALASYVQGCEIKKLA